MAEMTMADLGFGEYPHEQPSTRYPIYTRGNAGEVWPEVAYPLSLSNWREHNDPMLAVVTDTGIFTDEDLSDGITSGGGCFGGYMYLNLSLARVAAIRSPGISVEQNDATYLGTEGLAPPYRPHPDDKSLRASIAAVRYGLSVLGVRELPELDEDRRFVDARRAELPQLLAQGDLELLASIRELNDHVMRLFCTHLIVSSKAGAAVQLLGSACERNFGDREQVLELLTGLGDVDSAAPSTELWKLGRLAAAAPEVSAAFDAGVDGLAGRLAGLGAAAEFNQAFDAFIERFGSRGPNEWETACDTWGTRPELALALVDRLRGADAHQEPSARTEALQQARHARAAELTRKLRPWNRGTFAKTLRAASVLSVGRERSKTTIVGLIHVQRIAMRELAERVTARVPGRVPEDMWFCTGDELESWIADPASMSDLIDARRATREEYARRVPPFVFDGELPPPDTWELREALVELDELGVGQSVSGLAAVPGVAEGRACVVTDPFDPRDLGPGDVLIAPLTDPAWTPLFVAAEAVVVDVGGQMSHAVIVAREFGMPCVVAATDATRQIPHGARVRVDGTAGTVTVLE